MPVHGFAIFQSDQSIVVAFYGNDRKLFSGTKEAVREAIAAGEPVRGMIFGPPTNDSSVEIFANNQRVTKRGLTTKLEIKTTISQANRKIVQPSFP